MTDTAAAHDLTDPATDPFAVADAAAAVIRERTGVERHDVALVLGSGWGQTGDLIGETLATIDEHRRAGLRARPPSRATRA